MSTYGSYTWELPRLILAPSSLILARLSSPARRGSEIRRLSGRDLTRQEPRSIRRTWPHCQRSRGLCRVMRGSRESRSALFSSLSARHVRATSALPPRYLRATSPHLNSAAFIQFYAYACFSASADDNPGIKETFASRLGIYNRLAPLEEAQPRSAREKSPLE
jgi:hypothetical protein